MHSETDFMDQEEAKKQAYAYYYRNDPDTRDFLGPIESKFDPVLNREIRQRESKVSNVRGGKLENMRDMTVYLDPVPHIRLADPKPLQGWYSSKGDNLKPNQRDRPCFTDAILTQPYGGWCSVGCHSFCYVLNSMYGYRASGLVSVPVNYGDYVRKQLASMRIAQAGYFSSFTDPFMPIEDWYHNTQQGATAFVEAGLPIFFLSRMGYPGWAFDLLARNPLSYMQKSLNTPNEDDWHMLSPGAVPLAQHFDEIREARRRGIYVSIQVNPMIPGVVEHSDIEHLIELLAEAGANHAIFKFVESNHGSKNAMVERLTQRFGENRMAIFRDLMTEHQAGNQYTISEDYRREGHRRFYDKCKALGMTSSLCYEYTKRDGRWYSMGPEFITSEQCHGQRVPWHTKRDGRFVPMEVCPPSGCLTCADTNDSKPRCGSELLGKALALKLPDFKRDPGIVVQ
jgi:DNA repair photolyase